MAKNQIGLIKQTTNQLYFLMNSYAVFFFLILYYYCYRCPHIPCTTLTMEYTVASIVSFTIMLCALRSRSTLITTRYVVTRVLFVHVYSLP